MARKPKPPTARPAKDLLAWLDGLGLPQRAVGPLRRDLEIALGLREAAPGRESRLARLDRARFVAELYRDGGGAIRSVPSVGALAIELLREAIQPAAPSPAEEGRGEPSLDEPAQATPAPTEPATPDAPAVAPARRRGRPRQADATAAQPAGAQAAQAAPIATATPAESAEPDEAQLRRLWRALHPQGRRAVLSYVAEQLVAR